MRKPRLIFKTKNFYYNRIKKFYLKFIRFKFKIKTKFSKTKKFISKIKSVVVGLNKILIIIDLTLMLFDIYNCCTYFLRIKFYSNPYFFAIVPTPLPSLPLKKIKDIRQAAKEINFTYGSNGNKTTSLTGFCLSRLAPLILRLIIGYQVNPAMMLNPNIVIFKFILSIVSARISRENYEQTIGFVNKYPWQAAMSHATEQAALVGLKAAGLPVRQIDFLKNSAAVTLGVFIKLVQDHHYDPKEAEKIVKELTNIFYAGEKVGRYHITAAGDLMPNLARIALGSEKRAQEMIGRNEDEIVGFIGAIVYATKKRYGIGTACLTLGSLYALTMFDLHPGVMVKVINQFLLPDTIFDEVRREALYTGKKAHTFKGVVRRVLASFPAKDQPETFEQWQSRNEFSRRGGFQIARSLGKNLLDLTKNAQNNEHEYVKMLANGEIPNFKPVTLLDEAIPIAAHIGCITLKECQKRFSN